MAIKAVIFDMGGVILRSEDETPRDILAESLGISHAELIKQVFGAESARRATVGEISQTEHWQSVADHFGLDAEALLDFQNQFWAGDRADRDLLDFIDHLRPKYATALLSNAWDGAREALTNQYDALYPFDVIIYSAEVKLAKPDPAIYHLTLEQLGVQPQEAIFVDDFIENIEAAQALGIHAVRFVSAEQAKRDVRAILNHG